MKEIQLHQMDLNLLATFEALVEDGSVAEAAERLHVTPSAVSHALGRLRTQFDDPLFVRVGGKMQPTVKAVQLAEDLVPVLRGLRRALEPQTEFDPATSNRVFRLFVLNCTCCSWILTSLYAFQQRFLLLQLTLSDLQFPGQIHNNFAQLQESK